jgi:hypothetical protein
MRRLIQFLAMLFVLSLAPSLAQFATLRTQGSLGFGLGSLGAEVEWLDPTLIVYPRGSVAYMVGANGYLAPQAIWGLGVYGGAAYYLEPDRQGLFGAVRAGGALFVQNSVGAFAGTAALSGGYRFVTGGLEFGLEGGLWLASFDFGNNSVVAITPTLALTAGFRF